jgi:UDP-2,4-diacetamido-2,4,6-trideoxy-beta-L-altropyranose hydrolase
MKNLHVIFRTDSSRQIGLGHLMRCISIADELQKKQINCIFLISNKNSIEILEKKKFKIIQMPKGKNEIKFIEKLSIELKIEFLIIDSKRKNIANLVSKLNNKIKIILIDKIISQKPYLTILPGVKEQFGKYPKNSLIGAEYVLFPKVNLKKQTVSRKNSILLSMGGGDKNDITNKIVKSFKKSNFKFNMIIYLGKFYKNENKIKQLILEDTRFEINKDSENLLELMKSSSLGIFAFGVSVYEAGFSRLPIVTISHSNENEKSAKILAQYGWLKHVGKFDQINYSNLSFLVNSILQNKSILKKMSESGKIIDGKGAERVAMRILKDCFKKN